VLDAVAAVKSAEWPICLSLTDVVLDQKVRMMEVLGVEVDLGLMELLVIRQIVDEEDAIVLVLIQRRERLLECLRFALKREVPLT